VAKPKVVKSDNTSYPYLIGHDMQPSSMFMYQEGSKLMLNWTWLRAKLKGDGSRNLLDPCLMGLGAHLNSRALDVATRQAHIYLSSMLVIGLGLVRP
jgi:hypothetical protein